MNQKVCKKLRKLAKELAANNNYPERGYLDFRPNRTLITSGSDENGMPTMSTFEYTGTIKNNPKTTRGIYRVLKKNAKA